VVEPMADPRLGPRPVVPQETCALVAADSADEAHYLCAVLNSSWVGFLVTSHSVRGGKGFGSPGMLDYLRIRRYDPSQPLHRDLALASREAHCLALSGNAAAEIQERIDRLAEQLRDGIAEEVDTNELRQAQKDELDRRLAAMESNPQAGSSWEDVKARLLSRP